MAFACNGSTPEQAERVLRRPSLFRFSNRFGYLLRRGERYGRSVKVKSSREPLNIEADFILPGLSGRI